MSNVSSPIEQAFCAGYIAGHEAYELNALIMLQGATPENLAEKVYEQTSMDYWASITDRVKDVTTKTPESCHVLRAFLTSFLKWRLMETLKNGGADHVG